MLVLGSPVDENGEPGRRLLGTLRKALELSRRDPEALIIVTGGAVRSQTEGPAMKQRLKVEAIATHRDVYRASRKIAEP